MSVLRDEPDAFKKWLSVHHPYIPEEMVTFVKGPVNQNEMNPYTSQVIILYKTEGSFLHLKGCIFYGTDNIVGIDALAVFADILPPRVEMMLEDPDKIREPWNTSLEAIKAHIDGTHFSFETLGKLLGLAPYVPEFCKFFLDREKSRDLSFHLPRFAHRLILPELSFVQVADYQRYWKRYGGNYAPRLWFLVPMEEINCDDYILYPGGYYHVPGREMNAWIWKLFTSGCARRKNKVFSTKKQEIIEYMQSYVVPSRIRGGARIAPTPKEGTDFEQFLAPCLKNGLYGNHFPKDQERMMISRALSNSGVPIQFLESRLNAQNDKFPHSSGRLALKQRWDYEAHYKKSYSAPYCEKMECPLLPGDSLANKKAACHLMFHSMFPDKKPLPAHRFKGPTDWLNW